MVASPCGRKLANPGLRDFKAERGPPTWLRPNPVANLEAIGSLGLKVSL